MEARYPVREDRSRQNQRRAKLKTGRDERRWNFSSSYHVGLCELADHKPTRTAEVVHDAYNVVLLIVRNRLAGKPNVLVLTNSIILDYIAPLAVYVSHARLLNVLLLILLIVCRYTWYQVTARPEA